MITFKRIISTARVFTKIMGVNPVQTPLFVGLNNLNKFNFAFMALFEQNKKPAELDPAFKRKTKLKGHIKHKKNSQVVSTKLNEHRREQKSKLANHKGLLKRIKIVNIFLIIRLVQDGIVNSSSNHHTDTI